MAYTSSRGYMINKLVGKGITKVDGKKLKQLGRQELIALYNREF